MCVFAFGSQHTRNISNWKGPWLALLLKLLNFPCEVPQSNDVRPNQYYQYKKRTFTERTLIRLLKECVNKKKNSVFIYFLFFSLIIFEKLFTRNYRIKVVQILEMYIKPKKDILKNINLIFLLFDLLIIMRNSSDKKL